MEELAIVSSLRQLCSRRPKERIAKRIAQLVESHLPRLVHEAHLCHTLVTVLPDPTADLLTSWRAVLAVLEEMRRLLINLPGMYFSILAMEVHAGSRPKKKQAVSTDDQRPRQRAREDEVELEADLEEQPTAPAAAEGSDAAPKGMQGKPHFHLLIYYPASTSPILDTSYAKRQLQALFPLSDVNQVHIRSMKSNDASRQRIVGAMTYILKGADCPVRRDILALIHPGHPMQNPTFVPGNALALGSTGGMILKTLLRVMSGTIEHSIEVAEATADAVYDHPSHRLSRETEHLLLVANKLRKMNIRISQEHYYALTPNTRFVWVRSGSVNTLPRLFADGDVVFLDICVRYSSKLLSWYKLPEFPSLPDTLDYRYVELRDALYDVRTGDYLEKDEQSQDSMFAFRYYNIHAFRACLTEPVHWLSLIAKQYSLAANPKDEMDRFLRKMAMLLRPRRPKEPIMFINGVSNSGKSTVIAWITKFYPPSAIATINDSVAPLSAVKGAAILVCDEFSTNKISRSNLLLLTDGTTGLTVRSFGRGAEYLDSMSIPQVYTSNFGHEPSYKNDESQAVMNRFEFFRWSTQLLSPNLDKAQAIFEETPFIVFYLNRINNEKSL